jgi:hypothetical protein
MSEGALNPLASLQIVLKYALAITTTFHHASKGINILETAPIVLLFSYSNPALLLKLKFEPRRATERMFVVTCSFNYSFPSCCCKPATVFPIQDSHNHTFKTIFEVMILFIRHRISAWFYDTIHPKVISHTLSTPSPSQASAPFR